MSYDWWTNARVTGGQTLTRQVDLATLPIYVRAGAILPRAPARQHVYEAVDEPLTLRVYSGAGGNATLWAGDVTPPLPSRLTRHPKL